jgi:thymidylate synthase
MLLQFADELKNVAKGRQGAKGLASVGEKIDQLNHIVEHLRDSDSHYVREENVL